jgi:hypothetical protein
MAAQTTKTSASDLDGELRAALDGDLAREVRFWRGRAEELALQIDTLQKRLLALTDHLPARYAQLLACDPADLRRETVWPDPLADWKETTALEPASVASELTRLWQRLGPLPPR